MLSSGPMNLYDDLREERLDIRAAIELDIPFAGLFRALANTLGDNS